MTRIPPAAALAVLLLAGACGDRGPTPAQLQSRRDAKITACVAEALQGRARTQLARLDTLLQESRARGTAPSLLTAPHTFAQVYFAYAEVRAHEAAYLDSAYHAGERRDSLRFEELAGTFRVRPPTPGSVEENAQRDWTRDFLESRRHPEHPCNRLFQGGESGEAGN